VLTNKNILSINHLFVKVAIPASAVWCNYVFTTPEFLLHFGIDLIAELLPPNPIKRDYRLLVLDLSIRKRTNDMTRRMMPPTSK
jgi:hypothetical protein